MPTTLSVLGQIKPAAATNEDAYTVPADTAAVLSSIVACNVGAVATTVRVAIRVGGASISDEHYIQHDTSLDGDSTLAFKYGITLSAGDVVTVYCGNGTTAFNLFGSEVG